MFNKTSDTCLYVGGSRRRVFMLKELCIAEYNIEIIEVFKPNVDFLKRMYAFPVIHGDIRSYDIKKYNVIFWSHGPEHISKDELIPTLEKLKSKCTTLVLLFPEGESIQGEVDDNIYEKHLTTLSSQYFYNLGYETKVCSDGSVAIWQQK